MESGMGFDLPLFARSRPDEPISRKAMETHTRDQSPQHTRTGPDEPISRKAMETARATAAPPSLLGSGRTN